MIGRPEEAPSPQSLVGGATIAPVPTEPGTEGRSEGALLALFLVLTLAASTWVLWRAEHDAIHDPEQKAARGEITGLDPESLLVRANVQRALDGIAKDEHPLVTNLRVSADRIVAGVRNADGFRKSLTIDPGFGIDTSDAGVGEDDAIEAAQINAAAPERMVRAVTEKTGLPETAVDYVTMSYSKSFPTRWYLFLDQGPARTRQWMAEADGSDVRKPGELSMKEKRANEKRRDDIARQARRLRVILKRRTACLQKASGAVAVSRCLERFNP